MGQGGRCHENSENGNCTIYCSASWLYVALDKGFFLVRCEWLCCRALDIDELNKIGLDVLLHLLDEILDLSSLHVVFCPNK